MISGFSSYISPVVAVRIMIDALKHEQLREEAARSLYSIMEQYRHNSFQVYHNENNHHVQYTVVVSDKRKLKDLFRLAHKNVYGKRAKHKVIDLVEDFLKGIIYGNNCSFDCKAGEFLIELHKICK